MEEMRDTRKIVLTALFIAIIVVMTFVPYTGYISYGGISITTLHIPVIIGAIVLGKSGGLLLGLTWGVLNLIKAYTLGTPEALIFMNPMISVVPRVITGFLIGLVADIFRNRIELKKYSIICGITGSLSNTVFVLTAIAIFGTENFMAFGATVDMIFQVLVSVNGIIELGLAIFLTPVIIKAINGVYPISTKEMFV